MQYSEPYVNVSYLDAKHAGGWIALHRSLQGGVPHAVDIVRTLRSRGFSFPWLPAFSSDDTELQCYRIVHQAWREELLSDLLSLLRTWEESGKLIDYARRPDFQQAVLMFRKANRTVAIERVTDCFRRTIESKAQLSELQRMSSVTEIECQLKTIWLSFGEQSGSRPI